MAGKTKDPEFRHPNTVAHMRSLTDEEAAEHPPVIRKAGGVHAEYWREGGRVRCREVGAGEASGGPAPSCPDCGRSMERQGRIGKTLPARLGQAGIKRRHFRCRECGGGIASFGGLGPDGQGRGACEPRLQSEYFHRGSPCRFSR